MYGTSDTVSRFSPIPPLACDSLAKHKLVLALLAVLLHMIPTCSRCAFWGAQPSKGQKKVEEGCNLSCKFWSIYRKPPNGFQPYYTHMIPTCRRCVFWGAQPSKGQKNVTFIPLQNHLWNSWFYDLQSARLSVCLPVVQQWINYLHLYTHCLRYVPSTTNVTDIK
jgi:hypothetical protein